MNKKDFTKEMVDLFANIVKRSLNQEDDENGKTCDGRITDLELQYRYNKVKEFCNNNQSCIEYQAFKGDFDDILNKMHNELRRRKIIL